jgi:hypothetical protein
MDLQEPDFPITEVLEPTLTTALPVMVPGRYLVSFRVNTEH